MIFMISFFLSMSILMETVGVWSRVIGSYNLEPTTGYSTHVRVATMGRFFILVSAPALGYGVDTGIESNDIALIGCLTFIIIFIFILIFIKYGIFHFFHFYSFLNRKKNIITIPKLDIRRTSLTPGFFFLVFFSFLLTATGVIIVNYFATIFVNNRAMIVQMASIVTMLGTILHVFSIDPKLSKAADTDKKKLLKYTLSFLYSRALASIVLAILFFFLYFFN